MRRFDSLGDRLPGPLVARYYAYQVSLSHGFVIPIIVEYLVSYRDLSYTAFGTTGAVFMAGWVLWELPTGYLGDRVGRRASLLVGSVLSAVAILALGIGRTLPVFVVAYLVWSMGVTFRSGSADAWLYDVLDDRMDAEDFSRVKGRGWSVRLVTTAVTSVLGSALAAWHWQAPFVANAALLLVGVPLLLTFPRSHVADADTPSPRELLSVIRREFTTRPLGGFVLYIALFFGLLEVTLSYVQPISTGLGIPVAALGWLYAGFSLVGAAAGWLTDDVRNRVGERTWFRIAPPATALLLVVVSFVPLAAIPVFFAFRFVRSLTTTLRSQYLNDHVGSVARATLLSAASMVFGLTAAAARQVSGVIADATSPVTLLGITGAAFLIAVAMFSLVETPVPSDPGTAGTPG